MDKKQLDFEKPFAERYLACANALIDMEHWLMVVGLSGNRDFERLKGEFIRHGAVTFKDIYRPSSPLSSNDGRARSGAEPATPMGGQS
jgi:hypothetical protein